MVHAHAHAHAVHVLVYWLQPCTYACRIPARFDTLFVAPQVAVQQIKQSSGATDASARFARFCGATRKRVPPPAVLTF